MVIQFAAVPCLQAEQFIGFDVKDIVRLSHCTDKKLLIFVSANHGQIQRNLPQSEPE